MIRLIAPLILAPSLAFAGVCETLAGLADDARAGTLGEVDPSSLGAAVEMKAATCGRAQEAAGAALYCYADHPFRDPAAEAAARRVEAAILGCFEVVAVEVDAEVNHPDSYAARRLTVDGAAFSLSVKDKGASGRTLVFVRVAAVR